MGLWKRNPTKQYEDKETTIRNIYRVLLSRGRIGMIIHLPLDKRWEETRIFLEISDFLIFELSAYGVD